jgi:hypothetical protein
MYRVIPATRLVHGVSNTAFQATHGLFDHLISVLLWRVIAHKWIQMKCVVCVLINRIHEDVCLYSSRSAEDDALDCYSSLVLGA